MEASGGSAPPAKERRGVQRPKGNFRGRFGPNPGFNIVDVIVRTAFFVLWAMQRRWSRPFHPSRRIVPYPRKKTPIFFVLKPLLFVLVSSVFNNMARRFPKHGDFYSVSPGFRKAVCQGICIDGVCQGVKAPSPGIFVLARAIEKSHAVCKIRASMKMATTHCI